MPKFTVPETPGKCVVFRGRTRHWIVANHQGGKSRIYIACKTRAEADAILYIQKESGSPNRVSSRSSRFFRIRPRRAGPPQENEGTHPRAPRWEAEGRNWNPPLSLFPDPGAPGVLSVPLPWFTR